MILNAYYDAVRQLLGGGDTDKQITHVGFGSADMTPTPSDTVLTDQVLTPVTAASYDPENFRLVKLHFELPRTEGNGLTIREIGLLTADGSLVARKTREPILKTPDMKIAEYFEIEV